MLEMLKVILLGIVEGITEWLPISSTGHLILVEEFVKLGASEAFKEMFNVVIQLGAIMAVVVLYFNKLNPFAKKKTTEERKDTIQLWLKVVVACLPAAVLGLLFDDWMDEHLHNHVVVSLMLIVYGVLFIVVEIWNNFTKCIRRVIVKHILEFSKSFCGTVKQGSAYNFVGNGIFN